jgi:hypothetical protein
MVRSSAINLFMTILVFACAGLALQSVRAGHGTALWDEIATQVELNRIDLKGLQGELDQLEHQKCFVSKSLDIYYEYLDECSTWAMGRYEKGNVLPRFYPAEKSWQVPAQGAGAAQYN